jgi:hypothetical protein
MKLFWGIACLIIDYFWIRHMLKDPIPLKDDLTGANMEGWAAALIILMSGIGLIIRHFNG